MFLSAFHMICRISCATSWSGRIRSLIFHLPGEGNPAPSTNSLPMPFLVVLNALPRPHQPAPRLGRLTPGNSRSSSVVTSSAGTLGLVVSSLCSSSDSHSRTSWSRPSLIGSSEPALSTLAVDWSTSSRERESLE
jgi:hypothetical protein